MLSRHARIVLALSAVASLLAACTEKVRVVGPAGSPESGAASTDPDCAGLEPSAPLSSPCCPSLGVDACGGGLFCAALDGRTVATCYPERSRADGASCTEDRQCTSGECNTGLAIGKCKAMASAACNTTLGCARSPSGQRMVCAESSVGAGGLMCLPTSGADDDPCETGADCSSGVCEWGVCVCVPKCDDRQCGDDRCGGSCGECRSPAQCSLGGRCVE